MSHVLRMFLYINSSDSVGYNRANGACCVMFCECSCISTVVILWVTTERTAPDESRSANVLVYQQYRYCWLQQSERRLMCHFLRKLSYFLNGLFVFSLWTVLLRNYSDCLGTGQMDLSCRQWLSVCLYKSFPNSSGRNLKATGYVHRVSRLWVLHIVSLCWF